MKIRNVRRFMNLIEYVRACAIVLTFGQMRMDYRNDFTFFIYSFCPQPVNVFAQLAMCKRDEQCCIHDA